MSGKSIESTHTGNILTAFGANAKLLYSSTTAIHVTLNVCGWTLWVHCVCQDIIHYCDDSTEGVQNDVNLNELITSS
jgi:hypothetical protein